MTEALDKVAVKDYNDDTANGVTITVNHESLIEQLKSNKDLQGGFDVYNMELVEIGLTEVGTTFKFVNKEES